MFIPIFRGKHQETNKAIGNINLILLQMHNSYYFISCRLFIFYLRLIDEVSYFRKIYTKFLCRSLKKATYRKEQKEFTSLL